MLDEAVQGFQTEGEFAQRHRTFVSEAADIAAIPCLKIARRNRSYVHSPSVGAKRQQSGQSVERLNSAFGLVSGLIAFIDLAAILQMRKHPATSQCQVTSLRLHRLASVPLARPG